MNELGQFNETELLETRRIASLRIHEPAHGKNKKLPHLRLCRNGIIELIFCVCAMKQGV